MESLGILSLFCTVGGLSDSGPEAFSVLLQDCPSSQWSRDLSRLLLLVLDLLKQAGGVVRKTVDGQLM